MDPGIAGAEKITTLAGLQSKGENCMMNREQLESTPIVILVLGRKPERRQLNLKFKPY
jgi:hypothetical protein